ncbi:hypothetical protein Tco_1175001 [Tanacetum coccineum]
MWYDRWCSISPIANVVSARDIHHARFSLDSKVTDLISNNTWIWPVEWGMKYPILLSVTVPSLDANVRDVLEWRNSMGIARPFSVSLVWNCIRPMHEDVDWCEIVWFSHAIPRHAFHLWIVWDVMKLYACLSNISASLESILAYIVPIAKRRKVQSVVAKLVLVASTYFI